MSMKLTPFCRLLPLLLVACAGRGGTAARTPVPSAAPFTPVATPVTAPTLLPPGTETAWSPDGRRYATRECCNVGIVVDPAQGRDARLQMSNGAGVRGWTADSRFVLFGDRHPVKGFAWTYVFDVQQWDWILETPGCPMRSTGDLVYADPCGDYPLAIAPDAPRFLMENGLLITLPDLSQVDLLPDLGDPGPLIFYPLAGWAPGGAHLAFVALTYPRPGFSDFETALYYARGDGTGVQRVPLGGDFPHRLEWTPDGSAVTVVAGDAETRYTVVMGTGELLVTPAP
jgi:hypothetical protein